MPFYAVVGLDHPDNAQRRDALRAAHRAFVRRHDGAIRFASAMLDDEGRQTGSIYIFEAARPEDVDAWTAEEPFCRGGIYRSLMVVEISPALNRLRAMMWPT